MLTIAQDTSDGCSVPSVCKAGERGRERLNRRIRIMVVEDEAIPAMDLEALLEELGYDVCDVVASAPEAVRAAEQSKPDLVLMDIRLAEGTDGVAAAVEIRARLGIRSVFLTAHTDGTTLARAQAAHPFAVLRKPYTWTQVDQALKQAIAELKRTPDN